MPEDQKTDGNGTTVTGTADEKIYSKTEFEEAISREADRRVTKAQQKWAEDMKNVLGASDLTQVKTSLESTIAQARQAETRADFAERAITAGISDIKAAWAVAKEYGFVSENGKMDFDKFKKEHPSLFASETKTVRSVAGAPTPKDVSGKINMNNILRQAVRGG